MKFEDPLPYQTIRRQEQFVADRIVVKLVFSPALSGDPLGACHAFRKMVLEVFDFVQWTHSRHVAGHGDSTPGRSFRQLLEDPGFDKSTDDFGFCCVEMCATDSSYIGGADLSHDMWAWADFGAYVVPREPLSSHGKILLADNWVRSPECVAAFRDRVLQLVSRLDALGPLLNATIVAVPRELAVRNPDLAPYPLEQLVRRWHRDTRRRYLEADSMVSVSWGQFFSASVVRRVSSFPLLAGRWHPLPPEGRRFASKGRVIPLGGGAIFLCLTENPLDSLPSSPEYRRFVDQYCGLGLTLREAGVLVL